MNLDELRSVRRTERQKDSLQHLRDSFYGDVADYIEERKAARSRAAEAADDPFSDPDVGRLTDEIETAEDVVEAIYERRVGKVVKLASFAAADMAADTNGLTAEEHDLFEDLVARIKQNRETVLDVLAGKRSGATDESTSAETAATPEVVPEEPSLGDTSDVLSDAMGGSADEDGSQAETDPTRDGSTADGPRQTASGDDANPSDDARSADSTRPADGEQSDDDARPTDEAAAVAGDGPSVETATGPTVDDADGGTDPTPADDADRVTVRITSDVGQIFGVDEREYDLVEEDVVTLPTTNAEPLVDRGAAERLD